MYKPGWVWIKNLTGALWRQTFTALRSGFNQSGHLKKNQRGGYQNEKSATMATVTSSWTMRMAYTCGRMDTVSEQCWQWAVRLGSAVSPNAGVPSWWRSAGWSCRPRRTGPPCPRSLREEEVTCGTHHSHKELTSVHQTIKIQIQGFEWKDKWGMEWKWERKKQKHRLVWMLKCFFFSLVSFTQISWLHVVGLCSLSLQENVKPQRQAFTCSRLLIGGGFIFVGHLLGSNNS